MIVGSTKKTDRHGTIEILLKVALNTIKQINKHCTYPNTCLLVKKLLPEDDLVNELINTIHTPQPLWKITFEKEKNHCCLNFINYFVLLLRLIFEILGINDIAEIVESGVKHHKPARLGINLKY
jgi:hypothetical protein